GCAARDACQNTLLTRETPCHFYGLVASDRLYPVYQVHLKYLGHKACTDTLNLVGACLDLLSISRLGKDRRFRRLYRNRDDLLPSNRLEVATYAGYGPSCSHAGHQDVHFAVRVVPYLGTGSRLVD